MPAPYYYPAPMQAPPPVYDPYTYYPSQQLMRAPSFATIQPTEAASPQLGRRPSKLQTSASEILNNTISKPPARAGTLASLLKGSGETEEQVKTIPSAVISKPTQGFQDIDPKVFEAQEE